MKCLLCLASVVLSAAAFAATESPNINTTPPPYAAETGGLYPIHRPPSIIRTNAGGWHGQGCVGLRATIGADGKPRDIKVWSHYPSDAFDQTAIHWLAQWRYHPRMKDGIPVATRILFTVPLFRKINDQEITGTHFVANGPQVEAIARATLKWLCQQPPMHGVAVVARNSRSPTAGTDAGASQYGENPAVYLSPSLPRGAPPGSVKIRFCIGPDGRLRDTVIEDSSPKGVYDETARRVLERVKFSARGLKKGPVWTCGLTALISFLGANNGKLGEIGGMSYERLSGHPTEPKLVAEKPVKLSLSIPRGTKLPPVAKVEVRLCIEKDGSVSRAAVVKADPPRLFDRAALETVAGWRFARSDARMCDVYEWVKFPLSGG